MSDEQKINGNLEKKVEHILINKTKFVYAIVIITLMIGSMFFKIQLDVALIKQNHEVHMQSALEKIADIEEQQKYLMEKLDKDHEAIVRLLQMHNQ